MIVKNRPNTPPLACVIGVLALLAAGAARGQQDLFRPAAESAVLDSASDYLTRLREQPTTRTLRIVEVDLSLTESADAINLNLPGLDVPLQTIEVDRRADADYTWFGEDADSGAHGILVVNGENMVGTVRAEGKLFLIRALGGGAHAVIEADESAFPPDHPPEFEDLEVGSFDPVEAMAEAVCDEITVVVGYTSEAAAEEPNIHGVIRLAVDETNVAYGKSGIGTRLKLVHLFGTSYVSGTWGQDLSRFRTPGDGHIDQIHQKRDLYGADLAVLIRKSGGACGLAYVMANDPHAFSVVGHDCATGYYSFGHEIGHNQGCLHNPEVSPETTPFAYGHGYRHDPGPWRTILSYNCPGGCERKQFFSNPDVELGGVATGTAAVHDNARVIDETACLMAGFRPEAYHLTLTPASIYFSKKGKTATLAATVRSAGGSPMPGVQVAFSSSKPSVAAAPGTVVTNAQGQAMVTVKALKAGRTRIEGEAQGALDTTVVKVPAVSPGGLLLLVLLAVVAFGRRWRRAEA